MPVEQILGQTGDIPVEARQHPIAHPYAKGKAINLGATTLAAAGGFAAADIVTAGYQYLTLLGRIGNATTPAAAAADLQLNCFPYEDDGTSFPNGLFAGLTADATARAASLQSNIAFVVFRFILSGLDKVNVRVSNQNATTALQGGTAIYYLQK